MTNNNMTFLQEIMKNNIKIENLKSLNSFYKAAFLEKALSYKLDNPKMTKKNIAKNLNISERTLSRYSIDVNEEVFQKKTIKIINDSQTCNYCEFVSKNKAGLSAHSRIKHKEQFNQIKYNNLQSIQKQEESIQKYTNQDKLRQPNFHQNNQNNSQFQQRNSVAGGGMNTEVIVNEYLNNKNY